MLKLLARMWERIETSRTESDVALAQDLRLMGEMVLKTVVASLTSAIAEDRDRSRYQQLYKLVRADGLGDWVAALDEILTGPPAQHLVPGVRLEARELTQKCGPGTWQYEAVQKLRNCLASVETTVEDLRDRTDVRRWFRDFVRLRNRVWGHGAPKSAILSHLCPDLEQSIRILTDNHSLFRREWAYLHRNLSGKYRITPLGDTVDSFKHLKSTTSDNLVDGVYVFLDQFVRVQLIESTPDADDFYFPNGRFSEKSFEMLSYITDDRLSQDARPFLEVPGALPPSETEGLGCLDVQGNCFGNLPPCSNDYVPRQALEAEVESLLRDDHHPVVTMHGSGGTGKPSLALTVLHRLVLGSPFQVVLWFSARDIDLLSEGPKRVGPHILDVDDVSKEYVRLLKPPERREKSFVARDYLAKELSRSSHGPTLFIFDNFETVTNPGEFFRWVETFVRLPNKVLITARHRDFRGDYPVEVQGMTEEECERLISSTAARLGISDLLTDEYRHEVFHQSSGHPYVVKILLGEVAKLRKLAPIRRIFASREDILTALFERTYANLSPAAQRVFLTLCNWRASVPVLALEAVLLRPENELMSVEEAVDELKRCAFLLEAESPSDGQIFLTVPLAAAEFGMRKLAVSSMKTAIQVDTELLHQFGAAPDVKRGIAPRIDSLFRFVATEVQRGAPLSKYLPMLEFIAIRHPRTWLLIARLHEESGGASSVDMAKNAVRHFLETASPEEAYPEWKHLTDLCRNGGDVQAEIQALVERAALPIATMDDVSYAANRMNAILSEHHYAFDRPERIGILQRLASLMEARLAEADATDLSRLGWLCLHLGDPQRAQQYASMGHELDPDHPYCNRLLDKLT